MSKYIYVASFIFPIPIQKVTYFKISFQKTKISKIIMDFSMKWRKIMWYATVKLANYLPPIIQQIVHNKNLLKIPYIQITIIWYQL